MPLSVVLRPVAESTGHHVVLGPGVQDRPVSIAMDNVTIEHALNTLLYPMGYGFKTVEKDLVILAQETRIFRIVLPPVTEKFDDVTSNESFEGGNDAAAGASPTDSRQVKVGTKIVVQNASEEISFWGDVRDNLKTLISPTGQFSINKPAGSVIVTDAPSYLDRIAHYFDDLNRRVTQQIDVDVKVLEVTLNNEHRFGVDWNILAKNLKTLNSIGASTNFISGKFANEQFLTFNADGSKPGSGVSESGFKVAIDALRKQGNVEVISQPRLTILNNQVAVIQVGSTKSYIDGANFQTTQTGTITSVSTSQVQQGITMRLLGNIVGDQIYLSLTPVVTTIDNIRSITSGNTVVEAPETTTKSINTLVKLKEGQTAAIGGLITSYNRKDKHSVPIVSKIPLLGKLFEYTAERKDKMELVIFITPRRG